MKINIKYTVQAGQYFMMLISGMKHNLNLVAEFI